MIIFVVIREGGINNKGHVRGLATPCHTITQSLIPQFQGVVAVALTALVAFALLPSLLDWGDLEHLEWMDMDGDPKNRHAPELHSNTFASTMLLYYYYYLFFKIYDEN